VKEGVRVLTAGDAVIAHVVGIKEEAAAEPVAGAVPEPEVAAKKGKKEEEAAAADKGKAGAKAPAAKAPAADKGKKK
jgi:hypothetical protein